MIKEDIIVADEIEVATNQEEVLNEVAKQSSIPQHIPRHMRRKFVQRFGLPTFRKQFEQYAQNNLK